MNASSQSFDGSTPAPDGEATAELPVLDVAAYEARHGDALASTDTWSAPTLNSSLLAHVTNLSPDPLPETTQATSLASKLEAELRSLASNLSELETRLAAKGERLTVIEKELAESRTAGQAASDRAASLAAELSNSRTALDTAAAQIQDLTNTVRERDVSVRLAGERESTLKQTLETRESGYNKTLQARATEYQETLKGRETDYTQTLEARATEYKQTLEARQSEYQQTLQTREAEYKANTEAEAARNATLIARHESTVHASQLQIARLQKQSASQLETLQSLEGRRGIFDSILRAMDLQILGRDEEQARLSSDLARNTTHGLELTRELDERSQRITQLEAELASLNARLVTRTEESEAKNRAVEELNRTVEGLRGETTTWGARVSELEAQIAAGNQVHAEALRAAATAHTEINARNTTLAQEKEALETQLQSTRAQSQEHATAVQQIAAEHATRLAQMEEQNAKIETLSTQVANQSQTILADSEKIRTAQEQISVFESDLKVNEEAINRLEADLRARNMRVEELTRINTRMQTDIADARRWLDERDSLMKRLETEAAHSSTLVDAIQRSVRSMAPGTTGPHEVVRESAGTRLLVRSSKDGREVVHVLGRKTTVGRTPDNDLQIDATFISRHHAVLLFTNQQTVIEDLNSTNGVYVNGKRTTRETLNDGDLVMIGKARFRFAVRPTTARATPESAPAPAV